jgi:hypothetical protein
MSPTSVVSTLAPTRDWEAWLATASGPASATEEQQRDRTEKRIRDAIAQALDIPSSVRVYVKGSYANNTNVRQNADVDIAVEWTNTIKIDTWGKTVGMTADQLGYQPVTETMTPAEYRRRVEQALMAVFDSRTIDATGDKHVHVAAGPNTLDADVVPCFALDRYDEPHLCHRGHRIYPKSGAAYVDNFPQQNYDNGVAKNNATGRRYKEIVRCTKRIIAELHKEHVIQHEYPGYLTESLVYNAPNACFGHPRRYDDLQAVFALLWKGLKDEKIYNSWTEPNQLVMLFRGWPNRIPANAHNVIEKAWLWIGVPNA